MLLIYFFIEIYSNENKIAPPPPFSFFILLTGYLAAQSTFEESEQVVQIKDIIVSPVIEVDTISKLPVEKDFEKKLAILYKEKDIT